MKKAIIQGYRVTVKWWFSTELIFFFKVQGEKIYKIQNTANILPELNSYKVGQWLNIIVYRFKWTFIK